LKDLLDASANSLIGDKKDFSSQHGFDNFIDNGARCCYLSLLLLAILPLQYKLNCKMLSGCNYLKRGLGSPHPYPSLPKIFDNFSANFKTVLS